LGNIKKHETFPALVRETVGIFQYERLGMQRYEGIKITVFLI
jgi:hypothetical protein